MVTLTVKSLKHSDNIAEIQERIIVFDFQCVRENVESIV